MKNLNLPNMTSAEVLSDCIASDSNAASQAHYTANRPHLEQGIVNYDAACAVTAWCDLPRSPNGHADQLVVGTLSKRQLMDLYSRHMVRSSGSARDRYDAILVAANGKCPFCGGIGHAKTLDHYLPKANFPLYSVHPVNLVPCCRDCNTSKSNSFPDQIQAQSLHPYLDADHFFDSKWTRAEIVASDPITAVFSAQPPDTWSLNDQQRAISHFEDYGLASRYSIEAGTELASLIYLRQTTFRGYPAEGFAEYLMEQGNNPATPINGWRRTLYSALASTSWFYETNF